ncbi:VID27-domain-containing protein [Fomitiporia mediterranea MF3/22]|uniref:VID27-domain-containing protein n=1 Tax=Fomitiporia mediterranea (strain MF3/22) TaxID=694068 RepID=UPI00044092A1|nr:VID27-domain-containing protein [Fomitiporia mediterranea MF3/22]EJD00993.1 VID27-domain-containing protein [Fomitiporia mediterranea MF3/22]
MNIVGRIFGFGASLQGSDTPELVKIPSGQLYLVRPGNIRSSRECIYNDAMATVRKAPSVEHNFQLVITRVFEEGEEDILEEEDENDDLVFLISTELEFRTGEVDEEPTLIWRDLDGDVDETYEFVATGANVATVELFVQCVYRAMYERKYKTSSDKASPADLQEFIWKGSGKKNTNTTKTKKAKGKASEDDSALTTAMKNLDVTGEPSANTAMSNVITKECELYLWDQEDGHFIKQADIHGSIAKSPSSAFEYLITAVTLEGQQLFAHKLTSDLNARWSAKLASLTWNHTSSGGVLSSWCFKFEGMDDFREFQEAWGSCLYEVLNHISWAKAKADEQEYILSSYDNDVEMQDVEDDEEDEGLVEDALGVGTSDQSESESEDEGDEAAAVAGEPGERNSQLTVGHKNDRTFVVRGDKIGVFRHTDEGKIEYAATIRDLGFKKMKSLRPKNMMLHDQDAKMVLLDGRENHSLFAMDIEYGKIVEEWKVDDNITVDHIAPKSKFSQTTGEQTLVGTSHNALFRIDPRMGGRGGNTMAENKQYTSKNAFSDVTTTAAGQLAVSSEKGDIRLFDTVGKIAKTALPAMGDPFIGIDVTADGRWIVATCKTYLLVIDTLIGAGRYAGSLGFDRPFPADAKPQPKRLQVNNEHVAYMGHEVSFTPARFNQGEGQSENAIVTSSGRYVIAWDFAKVKKGRVDAYTIKKYEDEVVQDNFRFGDDKEIIVALSNDVLAINKKSLKRLPRASFNTPPRQLTSKSNIVNSPF